VIRIGEGAPILDGKRDDAYEGSATLRSGGSTVSLSSDPRNLHILIESAAATFSFTIQHAGRVTGEAAVAASPPEPMERSRPRPAGARRSSSRKRSGKRRDGRPSCACLTPSCPDRSGDQRVENGR